MKKELSELQIKEKKMENMKKKNGDGSVNKKQKQTQIKERDEFKSSDLEFNIRTHITHNKGGKWDLIPAPVLDSNQEKLNCYLEEGCSLNLQIYSSNGIYAPPYSQESSIGLIMAVGNIGTELDRKASDRVNTYLSRDGGLNWEEVMKGPHIYEFGDHGGLIVAAKNNMPTKDVVFTFNEGKTWHTVEISKVPIEITNIIIEPLSIS